MSERPRDARLSVVIPCYNEESVLPMLESRLVSALEAIGPAWEIVFVDDGSQDGTFAMLQAFHRREPRAKVLRFSRNFGHQTAVWAGLHYATGDAIAVLDADLQDPPELLRQCLNHWREGYDVIFAVRATRKESFLKRGAYRTFYRLLRLIADVNIPLDSGDFCVMDRRVADVLRQMGERNIFVRGMRAWSGFRQIGIRYERDARAAGDSKYPLARLMKLAFNGIFAFSTVPLRLATWLGVGSVSVSLAVMAFILVWRFGGFQFMGHVARDVPGWTGVVLTVLFIGGVQLVILGVMGEYLARVYEEVKRRPRWVLSDTLGIERRMGDAE